MAEKKQQDDLDLAGEGSAQAAKKKSPILLIVVAVVILGAASGVGWFFLTGAEATNEAEMAQSEKVEAEDKNKPKQAEVKPAKYVPFGSDIVVNIGETSTHNLVIAVSLMTRDDETFEALKKHKPLLRNALIELYEEQNYQAMKSRKGKQALRQKSLETIKEVLIEQKEKNQVEAVLFTNFMMD